jgi:predicted site-specific integrase-resolvase
MEKREMTTRQDPAPDNVDFVRRREETARRLGISMKTLSRIQKRGEVESTKITDRIVGFRDSAINKILNSRAAV